MQSKINFQVIKLSTRNFLGWSRGRALTVKENMMQLVEIKLFEVRHKYGRYSTR